MLVGARVCVCMCVWFVQVFALRLGLPLPLEPCNTCVSPPTTAAIAGSLGSTWSGVVGFGFGDCSRPVSSVDFVVLIKYVHALRDPNLNADKNIIKNCCTRMLRRVTELIQYYSQRRKSYLAFYARCVTVWLLSALKSYYMSAPPLVPFSLPFSLSLSLYLFVTL